MCVVLIVRARQEAFEKQFVQSRFGSTKHDVEAIKCAGHFVCKSESSVIDRVTAVVDNTNDTLFLQLFPKLVDVNSFLRVTAFDVLTDQLDGPVFSGKVSL